MFDPVVSVGSHLGSRCGLRGNWINTPSSGAGANAAEAGAATAAAGGQGRFGLLLDWDGDRVLAGLLADKLGWIL